MVKLLVLLAVLAAVQISYARDLAETINITIREQLNLYDKFLKEPDSAKFAGDLQKLKQLSEGALKIESADEKRQILSTIPNNFSPEFNGWINSKLEEVQVNSDIQESIEFYRSLKSENGAHEAEIKKTLSNLENLLKETDLKKKVENLLALDKTFSADFQKFLKESTLPNINRRLQTTSEFFGNLLHDKDSSKFANDIQALKTKTDAALDAKVSIDEKTKVLQEVTYTSNEELNAYLQRKNVEYS